MIRRQGKHIEQMSSYCRRILKKLGIEPAKHCYTPTVTDLCELMQQNNVSDAERDEVERIPYRALIGSLMYLSCHTRPDISFAVNQLARFVESPCKAHWEKEKEFYVIKLETLTLVLPFGL